MNQPKTISISVIHRTVEVDGERHEIPLTHDMMTDQVDAPITAMQFKDGKVDVEYGRPLNYAAAGAEALDYVKPYLDAWKAEKARKEKEAKEATAHAKRQNGRSKDARAT
jgi:hypothetical protein